METENHSDSTVFEQKDPINLNSSMQEAIKKVVRQKMEFFSEENMERENHLDSTVFEQKKPINLNSSMEETIKNVYRQKMEIISKANRTQTKYKSNLWSTPGSNQVISNFRNSNLNDSRIYGRKNCSIDLSLKDQSTARSPLKDIRNSKRRVSLHYDQTDNERRPWREIQSRNFDKKHRQSRSCSTERSDQSLRSSSPKPDSNSPKRQRRSRSDSTDSDPKNQRNRHRSGSSEISLSSDSNPKNQRNRCRSNSSVSDPKNQRKGSPQTSPRRNILNLQFLHLWIIVICKLNITNTALERFDSFMNSFNVFFQILFICKLDMYRS